MRKYGLSYISLGLFWLASLGIVFVLGVLSAFAFHLKPGVDGSSASLSIEERQLGLVVERFIGEPADFATLRSFGHAGLAPQLEQTLRAILRNPDADLRFIAIHQLLSGLPSRQLMAAIRFLQELPVQTARNEALQLFVQRWGQQDGRSAIAWATSLNAAHDAELAVAAVLNGWARVRPLEAWAWVVEKSGTPRRAQNWLEIILVNLERVNRPQAFELLRSLPNSQTQIEIAVTLMDGILMEHSPRSAMNWLAELPDNAVAAATTRLAVVWSRTEPEAAAQWLFAAFPDEYYGMQFILREWAFVAPERAATWVMANYRGERLRLLMDGLASEWIANSGPIPIAQWINQRGPEPALDGAIERLALATAPSEPATALVWAQSISNPQSRSLLEMFIARQWLEADPDAAEATLGLLLESETVRRVLLPVPEPPWEPVTAANEPMPVEADEGLVDPEDIELLLDEAEADLLGDEPAP